MSLPDTAWLGGGGRVWWLVDERGGVPRGGGQETEGGCSTSSMSLYAGTPTHGCGTIHGCCKLFTVAAAATAATDARGGRAADRSGSLALGILSVWTYSSKG